MFSLEKSEEEGVRRQTQKTVDICKTATMQETYFWGAPKSLQMVTAAMKLKDSCSLEEKL